MSPPYFYRTLLKIFLPWIYELTLNWAFFYLQVLFYRLNLIFEQFYIYNEQNNTSQLL